MGLEAVILLTACSIGVCYNIPSNPHMTVGYPITINSANTIPVVNGDSTTTSIAVHNNANYQISGITYAVHDNSLEPVTNNHLHTSMAQLKRSIKVNAGTNTEIDPVSSAGCAVIPANSECELTIHTSTLTQSEFKASFSLTANYSDSTIAKVSSQTFDMQYVPLALSESGIVFLGGTQLYSHGNSNAYGSVYYYVGGASGVNYTIDGESTSMSNLKITNPVPVGHQATVGSIGVVELGINGVNSYKSAENKLPLPVNDDGIATVSIQYSLNGTTATATNQVEIIANTGNPLLISGLIPDLNSESYQSSVMYVTNVGTNVANIAAINYESGLSNNPITTTCGAKLESGVSCQIGFNILTQAGKGNINVTYDNGQQTHQLVNWYNLSIPYLVMIATPNPLSFYIGGSGQNYDVKVYNFGNLDVNNLVNTQSATGSATPTVMSPISCVASDGVTNTTPNILSGGRCTYTIGVNDSVPEHGIISNQISGVYGSTSQPYSEDLLDVDYTALDFQPFISLSASSLNPQIFGDGNDTQIITVTVNNSGAAPAVLGNPTLDGASSYFSMVAGSNNCPVSPATLPAFTGSCSYQIKFGPVINSTTSSEVGVESSAISFSGGVSIGGNSSTGPINFTVLPDSQNIVMISESAFGSSKPSGTGGAGVNAFDMKGYIVNGGVSLTIQNQGSNPMTLKGLTNQVSPIAWEQNTTTSTCKVGTPLQPNETCTIVYDYLYNSNVATMTGGSSGPQNITTPILVYEDSKGSTFIVQPTAPVSKNYLVYANSDLATLTNTVSLVRNATTESMIITSTLANATGYSLPITQDAVISDSLPTSYFVGSPWFSYTGTASCTFASATASYVYSTLNCTYGSGDSGSIATYSNNSVYLDTKTSIAVNLVPVLHNQGLIINSVHFSNDM